MFQIEKLKTDFDNIIVMKKDIRSIMGTTNTKLLNLKNTYNKLIKDNAKQIFLFCLDSFFYQYKIFAMELESIEKLRCILNNRMYCDYYKLHNIILRYIKENKNDIGNIDELELRTFPVYKDLEPFIQYEIDDIRSVHNTIIKFVVHLYKSSELKSYHIESYNNTHSVGFSISNFLNTLTHENDILHKQITLYVNYLSFFHISQKKQLSHLAVRLQDFCSEVDQDLNNNHIFSIDDIEDEPNRSLLISLSDSTNRVEICPAPPTSPIDSSHITHKSGEDIKTTFIDSIPDQSDIEIKDVDVSTIPKFVQLAVPREDDSSNGNISPISAPDFTEKMS